MGSLLLLSAVSFFLALVLTPAVRELFRAWGVLDHPDQGRKTHPAPIPRAGGLVIAICYVAAFGALLLTSMSVGRQVWSALPVATRLLPAVCVVFVTGLLDDIYGLKAWQKLIGQTMGSCLVCAAGVWIDAVAGRPLDPWIGIPATVFWLTACSNAFNLIDGLDGLAAGMGLLATLTMLTAGLVQGQFELALATAPLAACLAGFLRYNFNPASVFLGDSGSLLIGFLLGCYGVIWAAKTTTLLGMTAPMIALAVPLLDTTLAIGRRVIRNQPVFGADRGHIHHRLLDRGLSPRAVALALYAAGGCAAPFALLVTRPEVAGPVLALFCACALVAIRHLKYMEFSTAARLFLNGTFARLLRSEMSLEALQDSLRTALGADGYWDALQGYYRELGFERIELRMGGKRFAAGLGGWEECWILTVPLGGDDSVRFGKRTGMDAMPVPIAELCGVLRGSLGLARESDLEAEVAKITTGRALPWRANLAARKMRAG